MTLQASIIVIRHVFLSSNRMGGGVGRVPPEGGQGPFGGSAGPQRGIEGLLRGSESPQRGIEGLSGIRGSQVGGRWPF